MSMNLQELQCDSNDSDSQPHHQHHQLDDDFSSNSNKFNIRLQYNSSDSLAATGLASTSSPMTSHQHQEHHETIFTMHEEEEEENQSQQHEYEYENSSSQHQQYLPDHTQPFMTFSSHSSPRSLGVIQPTPIRMYNTQRQQASEVLPHEQSSLSPTIHLTEADCMPMLFTRPNSMSPGASPALIPIDGAHSAFRIAEGSGQMSNFDKLAEANLIASPAASSNQIQQQDQHEVQEFQFPQVPLHYQQQHSLQSQAQLQPQQSLYVFPPLHRTESEPRFVFFSSNTEVRPRSSTIPNEPLHIRVPSSSSSVGRQVAASAVQEVLHEPSSASSLSSKAKMSHRSSSRVAFTFTSASAHGQSPSMRSASSVSTPFTPDVSNLRLESPMLTYASSSGMTSPVTATVAEQGTTIKSFSHSKQEKRGGRISQLARQKRRQHLIEMVERLMKYEAFIELLSTTARTEAKSYGAAIDHELHRLASLRPITPSPGSSRSTPNSHSSSSLVDLTSPRSSSSLASPAYLLNSSLLPSVHSVVGMTNSPHDFTHLSSASTAASSTSSSAFLFAPFSARLGDSTPHEASQSIVSDPSLSAASKKKNKKISVQSKAKRQ